MAVLEGENGKKNEAKKQNRGPNLPESLPHPPGGSSQVPLLIFCLPRHNFMKNKDRGPMPEDFHQPPTLFFSRNPGSEKYTDEIPGPSDD